MFSKLLLLIIASSFLGSVSFAQEASKGAGLKQAIFGEYNSTSTAITLNYERLFSQSASWKFYYRAGVGIKGDGTGIPLGFGAIRGRKDHHGELSLLAVPFVQHVKYLFKEGNRADGQLYLIPAAGYRYSPQQSRIFAKVLAGPALFLDPRSDDFWKMDGKNQLSISVGAGYRF